MPNCMRHLIRHNLPVLQSEEAKSMPTLLTLKTGVSPLPSTTLLPVPRLEPATKDAHLRGGLVGPKSTATSDHGDHTLQKSNARDEIQVSGGSVEHLADAIVGHPCGTVRPSDGVEDGIGLSPRRPPSHPAIGSRREHHTLTSANQRVERKPRPTKKFGPASGLVRTDLLFHDTEPATSADGVRPKKLDLASSLGIGTPFRVLNTTRRHLRFFTQVDGGAPVGRASTSNHCSAMRVRSSM